MITDNHLSHKRSHDVRDAIAALGARHLFIKAHCPWQNGKVERFNRTLAIEWAYRRPYLTTHRRPCPLARGPQHCSTPLRTRRTPAHQSATNLMAEYN